MNMVMGASNHNTKELQSNIVLSGTRQADTVGDAQPPKTSSKGIAFQQAKDMVTH